MSLLALIHEHDRVVLLNAVPAEGLEPGDVGAVVHVYGDGGAYEVAFTGFDGHTAAVAMVEAGAVRAVTSDDIAHARGLGAA